MTTLLDTPKPSPIEVWLRKRNIAVTCMVVFEDEGTEPLNVTSLSLRGARREVTGWCTSQGYAPVGRWKTEDDSEEPAYGETVRRFRLATWPAGTPAKPPAHTDQR